MKQKSNLFKTLGIMLLFVLFATQANAQNITVTGTVSDNLGPVIGASIQVEGTSNGCITDIVRKLHTSQRTVQCDSCILVYRLSDPKNSSSRQNAY